MSQTQLHHVVSYHLAIASRIKDSYSQTTIIIRHLSLTFDAGFRFCPKGRVGQGPL